MAIGSRLHPKIMSTPCRCKWCEKDPLYIKYHDIEWGVPVHDDQKLFEDQPNQDNQENLEDINQNDDNENNEK